MAVAIARGARAKRRIEVRILPLDVFLIEWFGLAKLRMSFVVVS